MTIAAPAASAVPLHVSPRNAARLAPVGPSLWRVMDRDGRVIGHVQADPDGLDVRWSARVFHAPSRAFRDLGRFWSADDAVDCVVFGR